MTHKLPTLGVVAAAILMIAGGRANAASSSPTFPASEVKAGLTVPAADPGQVLLNEDFNTVPVTTPGSTVVAGPLPVGPEFTGINYRVLQPPNAACANTSGSRCLILTGLSGFSSSSLVSKPVTLLAGVEYFLSFDAFGNPVAALGTTNALTVTLGTAFDQDFTLVSRSPVGAGRRFSFVPTSTMTVPLDFSSHNASIGLNGPVLDNILLQASTASAPEPATLGLMVLGLLGGAGLAGRKRRN